MKKIVCMAAVLFAAFSMVSCSSSPESKAEDFMKEAIELMKEGDQEGLKKLEKEIDEYREGLSEEDKKAFDEAGEKAAEKYKDEVEEAAKELTKKALEEALG